MTRMHLQQARCRAPRTRSPGALAWALVALIATSLLALPRAEARPRPQTTSFQANKQFGIGFMLGAPTGLSGKYYLSGDTALDFGIGAIGGYGRRSGLHLHADFLWHPAVLATTEPFVLPIYFGLGGRLWDFDYDDDDDNNGIDDDGDIGLGARAPIGIMMDFNNVPIDIFFELALVLDFIVGDGDVDVDLNGALGFRYYFW